MSDIEKLDLASENQRLRERVAELEAQVRALRVALVELRGFCVANLHTLRLYEVRNAFDTALAATPAPTHDYSGLCAAPSCEGHCGYVHARGCEAVREYLADHGGEPYRALSPPDILRRVAERVRDACARVAVENVRHSQQTTDQCRMEVRAAVVGLDLDAIIKEATRD